MSTNSLHEQRFELKYRVASSQLSSLRAFIGAYLEQEASPDGSDGGSRPVESLYLDSPDRRLLATSLRGERSRLCLRVRRHEAHPGQPALLELKTSRGAWVRKQRASVRRECVSGILAGLWPSSDFLVAPSAGQVNALYAFHSLLRQLQAVPALQVGLQREAWNDTVSQAVRVTLDSEVRASVPAGFHLREDAGFPEPVFPGEHILEIKFTGMQSLWFRDLVQCFDLVEMRPGECMRACLEAASGARTTRGARVLKGAGQLVA